MEPWRVRAGARAIVHCKRWTRAPDARRMRAGRTPEAWRTRAERAPTPRHDDESVTPGCGGPRSSIDRDAGLLVFLDLVLELAHRDAERMRRGGAVAVEARQRRHDRVALHVVQGPHGRGWAGSRGTAGGTDSRDPDARRSGPGPHQRRPHRRRG